MNKKSWKLPSLEPFVLKMRFKKSIVFQIINIYGIKQNIEIFKGRKKTCSVSIDLFLKYKEHDRYTVMELCTNTLIPWSH